MTLDAIVVKNEGFILAGFSVCVLMLLPVVMSF